MEVVRGHVQKHYNDVVKEKDSPFPFQVYKNPQELHVLMQVLYLLCRVCKFKKILKLLPHEVSDLEPVFKMLQSQGFNIIHIIYIYIHTCT